MNGRWLMRRSMGTINTPKGEDEAGMLTPPAHRPSGEKLLADALNTPGQIIDTGGREPVTAVLSAEVKLLVGIVDQHGMPAGPVPIAPQTLARLDPEKR